LHIYIHQAVAIVFAPERHSDRNREKYVFYASEKCTDTNTEAYVVTDTERETDTERDAKRMSQIKRLSNKDPLRGSESDGSRRRTK